ncbi:hypothetical protein BCGKFG_BCGKFG_13710, partial [Dysosmobacter welbionis]
PPHVHRIAPKGRAIQGQAALRQQRPQLFQPAGPHRAAEHRTHGGPNGLGIVQVRAGVHQKQSVGVKGVRRPEDRPHIPRILNPVQDHVP